MIDLRSDTVTQPTPEMRKAIAEAPVGDDVLGDDPTVNELERRTAEVLGKAAAVYMPSGTMTNQVAVRCATEPGDEIFLADNAHTFWYEAGGPGAISGVMCRLLPSRRGVFPARAVREAVRPMNYHFAPPKLVCVENTNNRGGGSIWPIEQVRAVHDAAREAGLALHMDGARLWNASIATGIPEREYARWFDTVSVCFSKGLGAPVGSCLAGAAETIERARRFRKMLGGGMRQAGILAAGALYALEHHRQRLAEDHRNAKALAEGIAGLPGIELDPESVQTNIVLFGVTSMSAGELVERLKAARVLVLATGPETIRAVSSLAVAREDMERAVAALTEAVGHRAARR